MSDILSNTNTIFGGSQIQQALAQSLADFNNANSSVGQSLNLQGVNVTVSDPVQPQQPVTLSYFNTHGGGGPGDLAPLNEINQSYPLSGNLDFSGSNYRVRGKDPLAPSDMAIKSWVQDQISHYTPVAIEALGDATTRTQMAQTGRFTYFQGAIKEGLQNGLTTDYQPRRYDQNYQIIDPNQLVTYSQTVLQLDEEKKERQAADTQLQTNIDAVLATPLNQWPTPMANPLLNHNFEMVGNRITGMPAQLLNFTAATDASSVQYVNDSVNQLATDVVGQIANVKTQCNSYTDVQVFNLKTQTDIDLAGKQDIVPLNEIPAPISQLNMAGHRIENLAIPTGSTNPDLCAVPKGYADARYATKTELADYITIQNANDAFRSRISTLSDIQAEEPAALNMGGYRIVNAANAVNPTDVPTYQQVIAGQGISQAYADAHYLAIATPLNQVNPPIASVSMNGQQLIDLPLVPSSNTCAITTPWAEDLANAAVATPVQNIDMSLLHKVTGLPVATDPSDAVRFDQLPDLTNYLTVTQGDSLYMPKTQTLSGIQAQTPQDLNMEGQRIVSCADPVDNQDVVTLQYFNTHSGPSGATDEIVNASGFSRVKVNADQTISLTSNASENLRIEPTLIVAAQPIFSTSAAPGDVTNAILTKSQLDPYYMPADAVSDHIQNATQSAVVRTNTDGTVSVKASGGSTALVVSSQNGTQYTVANSGDLALQSNGILTLNAGQYTQTTTPLISNSSAPTTQYQVLNRNQNDARYYQSTTPINQITGPTADVAMGGYTLSNIRDAIDNLEPTNLAQVQSLIANSGFKNKIQSTSGHAQVQCANGSDNVTIKANNATTDLTITSDGISTYNIGNSGELRINAANLNVGSSLAQFIGTSAGGSIFFAGDLRSTAVDFNFPDQILTREQNDARYLSTSTSLSSIDPPTAPVDFSGQLLRNLQTPVLNTDAATKAFVDGEVSTALVPYSTSAQIASTYLTQADAASTYITPSATDTKISTALVPYLTSSTAASTYLTQANAASTYQPQSTPFTSIANGVNTIEAQASNGGHKIYAGLSGAKTNILDVFAPAGQPSGTCEIQGKGRLNIISNLGLTSIMAGVGTNVSTLTVKSAGDTLGQLQYDNLVIGSRSTAPQLQLSSGHDASNNGYSLINNANSVAVNTLQLSPEISANVVAGNNLLMYANAAPVAIKNQFNKATGLAYSQSSPQSNEFVTKAYADATYTGGGTPTQIQDSTGVNKVACSSSNVQIYTPLLTGQPSLIFKQSAAFSTYLEMNPSNVSGGLYISYPNIILQVAPTCFTDQTTAGNTQLIQKQYADSQYYAKTTPLQSITAPTANVSLNNNLITNLASGTIASGNTSSVTGGNVYDYIATLPSVVTQQVYTVTAQGSTTNGFLWTAFPNTAQTGIVQCQRVKGAGAQMITSSVITAQSQTLADNFASLQFTVANSTVRVTQVVPYTTTNFTAPGQQNIASLTFSQQPVSGTSTCIQLYKPATSQGSATFILYVYVDQF